MAPALAQFISAHALRVPSACYSVKELLADFLATLPKSARGSWRRSRLIADLTAAGYVVAIDPRTRAFAVAGLAPKIQLQQVDGVLVAHA